MTGRWARRRRWTTFRTPSGSAPPHATSSAAKALLQDHVARHMADAEVVDTYGTDKISAAA
jgi:hypothetical protein